MIYIVSFHIILYHTALATSKFFTTRYICFYSDLLVYYNSDNIKFIEKFPLILCNYMDTKINIIIRHFTSNYIIQFRVIDPRVRPFTTP